ncbi:autophagy-related protein 13-like [Uloborus diversus]|uniref:autophagy-related protein 13-like n=1 Tax=Uloborus diversus TaxID=327109 RepID=UPI002409D806|nr:autophagy-related protein 13-like [Uloborus diversus]XP_054707785.1 autophagy-related protein 13-like [Uloborus diversus]
MKDIKKCKPGTCLLAEDKSKMNENRVKALLNWDLVKLEKYVRALIENVPQSIVQSRCGEPKSLSCGTKSSEKNVFEIGIEDHPEIQAKVREACLYIQPLKEFTVCVEILLKTSEGDTLVLELWHLRMEHSEDFWDARYKMYCDPEVVFGNMMCLMKSVITISRAVPTYKLSLKQSADTYVILYRIYQGDPQIELLGKNPLVNKIAEVLTPVGTISMSVAYRSKDAMTIPPKKNSFMLNSDYFNVEMNSEKNGGVKTVKNQNLLNSQKVGAFARCSILPNGLFPELSTFEKPFLNLSRGKLDTCSDKEGNKDNHPVDLNCNSLDGTWDVQVGDWIDAEIDCEKLTNSDVSNGSDFVFVDMRPPFASCNSTCDLGAFFHECQHAPPLSSFASEPTLEEQVFDVTSQLEKFELSMTEFDSFVESVCCIPD